MATGRIRNKDRRVYVDGYDVSGMSNTIGPLALVYDEVNLTAAMGDTAKGYLKGAAQANLGTLSAVFDNTATTGAHTVLNTLAGSKRTVLVAQGVVAAPAQGDPAFGGQFMQKEYRPVEAGGGMFVTVPFSGWASDAATLLYASPWGVLLHANSAATAANTAVGVDDNLLAAATTRGGYLVYHATAGDGTATIKVQDAATNSDGSFSDLTGATSGVIDCSTVKYGLVAITPTATVRRYLRWQIVLGTATTVTFILAFFRA